MPVWRNLPSKFKSVTLTERASMDWIICLFYTGNSRSYVEMINCWERNHIFFLPSFPLPQVSLLLISALLESSSSHTIVLSSATAPSGACGFVCFFLFYSVGQLMFFTCWNLILLSCKTCGIGLVRSRDPFLTKGGSLEGKKGGSSSLPWSKFLSN